MSGESQPPEIAVRVHRADEVDRLAMDLFGRPLSPAEWGQAIGAPIGALVEVAADPVARAGQGEVLVIASHPLFAEGMERRFFRGSDGRVVCRNERFVLHSFGQGRGIGAAIFARQVDALRQLGVARIELDAAGAPASPYRGYYVWPRLGCDAPLAPDEQRRLPAGLTGATTLHELLTRPGGVAYWRLHGSGREVMFDLSPNSPHGAILRAYLEEKGW